MLAKITKFLHILFILVRKMVFLRTFYAKEEKNAQYLSQNGYSPFSTLNSSEIRCPISPLQPYLLSEGCGQSAHMSLAQSK